MKHNYQEQLAQLLDNLDVWYESPERRADGAMTSKLYPYEALFSPIRINSVKIKNRIVMGPMVNAYMCTEQGRPNDIMLEYYAQRARGGTGLILTGAVPISFGIDPTVDDVDGTSFVPRIEGHRALYSGWRSLAERVHAYGSKIFIQLTPGMGRVGPPECVLNKFQLPVSSSWNSNYYVPQIPCVRLSDRNCKKIIKNAGQASIDARELMIDGVYLHGHEGYLLEQMTNTAFNRRKVGRFSNWQAFGIDMIKEIRKRCGVDYPIMYRIGLSMAFAETYGDTMKKVPLLKKFANERTVEMTLDYMKNLVAAGVDAFDVDLGGYENPWLPHPPAALPPGCFLPIAGIVRDYFSENRVLSNVGLPVPVVAVGKLGYPDLAERALRDGMCDMIMLARPLLADAEWPNKTFAGRVDEITPCIGDHEACMNEMIHGGHLQCAVNPMTGNEHRLCVEAALTLPAKRKRIAIVGAGPAGVTCACAAARRGHDVTIFEAGSRSGGALIPGSVSLTKFDLKNYVNYLGAQLSRVQKSHSIKTKFNTRATANELKNGGFDAIVTCCGASYSVPNIDGINAPHVKKVVDLLVDPEMMKDAQYIVIIGGGDVGCETAHFCAYEHGKNVAVIEMLPYFMKDSCSPNRTQLIYTLGKKGVSLINCARALRITKDAVIVARNVSPTVPDPYVTWVPVLPANAHNPLEKKIKLKEEEQSLRADLVIIAAGARPDDSLYEQCVCNRAAPEIRNIGDSFEPGRVFEAVKAGYAIGCAL